MATLVVLAMQAAHRFFPGDASGAFWGRLAILTCGIAVLVAVTRWLLARDGFPADRLGLGFGRRQGAAILIGATLATLHILALAAALHVVAPFDLGRGPVSGPQVGLAAAGYLASNFIEELLFRGYLLIVLARWIGTTRALWLLALPFGLFHFPGLDPEALLKTLLTTGAMHFSYAYVLLATRSLWAAVAMHAVGNTLLHSVMGTGKPAFLSLHYQRDFPTDIDAPFWIFFGVSALMALGLAMLPATRRGKAQFG